MYCEFLYRTRSEGEELAASPKSDRSVRRKFDSRLRCLENLLYFKYKHIDIYASFGGKLILGNNYSVPYQRVLVVFLRWCVLGNNIVSDHLSCYSYTRLLC